jgi:heme exporter protein A
MVEDRSFVRRVRALGVTKRFGPTVALRGVDATLEAGALTLIEGANGSGKTTLLGVLGAMIRASGGEVTYDPIGRDLASVRRELGWLSHDALAYGDLTGKQNIELSARLRGLDADEVWRGARDRFELGAFAERPLRTNSRGQRQRIGLARALGHSPSLVLLDEPTTGLDVAGVERLVVVLEEEVRRGAVVAVVSHEAETFRSIATRRVVLDRGRVASATEGSA